MPSINDHLKAEGKLPILWFAIVLAVALFTILVAPWIEKQLAIDRCLDSGGSYDYESNTYLGPRNDS